MTILTSANGSLPLTLRKGETLVIRNYSGSETVTGSNSIRELSANGLSSYGPQPFDATVTVASSGDLDYQVVVGDVTIKNNEFQVSGASRPVIAGFGDSFLGYGWHGWLAPWGRNESTTLPGITFGGMERNVTNAAHTLSYNASNRTCTFDGGPATTLVNGMQIIPGASAKTGCMINVRLAALGSSNGGLTCTRAGTRPDEIVYSNSALWWFGVLSNQGYIVKNYAHSGGWMSDGPSIVARTDDFDAFVINYHTNDITGGKTLAQLQADTVSMLDATYAKSRSKKGIVNGCCTFRTGWSTAQAEIADAFNRWLPGALKAYPGVVARFPWSRLISEAGNAANTALMNSDNIHPDDPAQMLAGKDWSDYFGAVLPGTPWDFGSALGVYSATNPTGNLLLNPNPAGDNSGRPTGWNALTVGSQSATPSKVARTDGVAGAWARITGTSITDNAQNFFTLPQALFANAPQNGAAVQVFVEVKLSGAGQMAPVLLLSEAKDATLIAYSRLNNSATKALPISDWTGVIALPPYVWSDTPGVATIDVRPGQRLMTGASGATLDIGRLWVGSPVEASF